MLQGNSATDMLHAWYLYLYIIVKPDYRGTRHLEIVPKD